MPLPPTPANNESNWFTKRDAFDQAVRDRLDGDLSPSALSTTYAAFSTIAPYPTGNAAVDQANAQNAINATPEGGSVLFRSAPLGLTRYKLTAPLVFSRHITIKGDAMNAAAKGRDQGGNMDQPVAPYLVGVVFEQTTAGADVFKLDPSKTGVSLHMENVGMIWADAIMHSDTGHGIYAVTGVESVHGDFGELETGIFDWSFRNVKIYGNDGNHYGFYFVNPIYGRLDKTYVYGGGGYYIEGFGIPSGYKGGTVPNSIFGNFTATETYSLLYNAGTAHSYVMKATNQCLNLITWVRPQSNITGAARASTPTVSGDYAGWTYQNRQYHWINTLGEAQPTQCSVVHPDLESPSNPIDYAGVNGGTVVIGSAKHNVGSGNPNVVGGFSLGLNKRGYVQFAAAGSTNWRVPDSVSVVRYRVVGGGGGGGAGSIGSGGVGGVGGGGGGAGSVVEGTVTLTPGSEIPVIIGAGGAGGSGGNGSAGGNSSFNGRSANGGGSGQRGLDGGSGGGAGQSSLRTSIPGIPGAGGIGGAAATNGTLAVPTSPGMVGGGGGGGASSTNGGAGGSARTGGTGGWPGSGTANGGTQGNQGGLNGANGATATGPGSGGGGGGGAAPSGTQGNGGDGAPGSVEIWW